jgi:hypothetical protein
MRRTDNGDQQQAQRDLTQVCGARAAGVGKSPMERIEDAVQPDETQRSALQQRKCCERRQFDAPDPKPS